MGAPTGPRNVAGLPMDCGFLSACSLPARPCCRLSGRSGPTRAPRANSGPSLGRSARPGQAGAFSTRGVDSASTARAPAGWGRAGGQGRGEREPLAAPSTRGAQTRAGGSATGRPSPAPAMAARRPQEPAKPLPACLGTLGTGSPRARPKLGGVFRCVEDAFENKTLQLDALGGGRRDPRAREPYSGLRGDPEGPGEPGGNGPEAAASLQEHPGAPQARGPQQVVAAGQRLRNGGACARGTRALDSSRDAAHPRRRPQGGGPGVRPLPKPPSSSEGRGARAPSGASSSLTGESGPGTFLSCAPASAPPGGLGLSSPGSGSLVRPGFWRAVSLCVSLGLAVSFSLCLPTCPLPPAPKLRALTVLGAALRGGASTAQSQGQWTARCSRPGPGHPLRSPALARDTFSHSVQLLECLELDLRLGSIPVALDSRVTGKRALGWSGAKAGPGRTLLDLSHPRS